MNDPKLYIFIVIGGALLIGLVRLWITEETAREIIAVVGNLEANDLSNVVIEECRKIASEDIQMKTNQEVGAAVPLSRKAYIVLQTALPGVGDEHSMKLLVQRLRHG